MSFVDNTMNLPCRNEPAEIGGIYLTLFCTLTDAQDSEIVTDNTATIGSKP